MDIDLIHINGLNHTMDATVAKWLNVPCVWHIRQFLEEDQGQKLYHEKHVWKVMSKADALIAISDSVKQKFESMIDHSIKVIRNGVPVNQYFQERDIFEYEEVRMPIPRRIDRGKGQLDAIKATKLLHDKGYSVRLTIVGNNEDSEYMKMMEDYINQNLLTDAVEIMGYKSDLSSIRRRCDIGLTCSKKEGFGRVTVEDQMSGLLVIGADTGGTVEIIDDKQTGYLYKEGNVENLANCITYAIDHKISSRRVAKMGQQKTVEEFSVNKVVDRIIEIYDDLCAKSM